ncbi:MAG TPA: hypothetical protein VFD70_27450 [Anaerolineae bacterium]|nr:hypothetical protein [Anaerolineae bacterium]
MDTLGTQLAQLENTQLIRRLPEEDLAYLFKHALTQEAAYGSLLHRRQREVHHRVARALEQLYIENVDDYAALLAYHYAQAGDDSKIVQYARMAGDLEYRRGAYPEARAHYNQALEALARLPDDKGNRRLRVELTVKGASVSFATENPERILARLAGAEPIARELAAGGDSGPQELLLLARLYSWLGRIHFYRNDRSAALAYSSRVVPVAQEAGEQELAALASSLMGRIMMFRGDFQKAEEFFGRALGPFERANNWTEWILAMVIGSSATAARGQYKTALHHAEQGMALAQEVQYADGLAIAYNCLALIYLTGNDMERVVEMSRTSLEQSLRFHNLLTVYSALATLAIAQSRLGQHEAAKSSLAQARDTEAEFGGRLFIDDWIDAFEAELALNAGEYETAVSRAENVVERFVDSLYAPALAHRVWAQALAVLNPLDWDDAARHFSSSLELFESGDARLEAARTHMAWGKLNQECGDWIAAREHFERAAAQFEESGLEREFELAQQMIHSSATES